MGLAEKLEKWAKLFDETRWRRPHERFLGRERVHDDGGYDVEAVELSDLLSEAAKVLRGRYVLVDEARHTLAKH